MKYYTITISTEYNSSYYDFYTLNNMMLGYISHYDSECYVSIFGINEIIKFDSLNVAQKYIISKLSEIGYKLLPEKLKILL
jgi:hypothetical protein